MTMGKCHICGEYKRMSFEHVPPASAFNNHKQLMYHGEQFFGREEFPWDFSKRRGRQSQRGIGFYTLCERCNNNTGSWYGSAFVNFIYKGYISLQNRNLTNRQILEIGLPEIKPLRILKQILCMFMSINVPEMADVEPDFRRLALSREARGISESNYGLYLYILSGSIRRYIGVTGVLTVPDLTRVVSELSTPPFGLVLEMNPKVNHGISNIISWGNDFEYNEIRTLNLKIPVLESNTHFPLDYRSKEQVIGDYVRNKLREAAKKDQKSE